MTNDRRNNDKALIFVLKKKEEHSRQAKPSFGFTDRIMQQVKISAHRKKIRKKNRTLTGIITMAVAASILLLVILNYASQDKEIRTKPNISLIGEDMNSPKTENTEKQTNTSPKKPQKSTQLAKFMQSPKTDGQKQPTISKSYKEKTSPTPNKKNDIHTIQTAMVTTSSTATGNLETREEVLRQEMDDATNYKAGFPSPQNLAADRKPEVCIECDFQEMETEMTAMINELETPTEP